MGSSENCLFICQPPGLQFGWSDDLDGFIAFLRINEPDHSSGFHLHNVLEIPAHQVVDGIHYRHGDVPRIIHVLLWEECDPRLERNP